MNFRSSLLHPGQPLGLTAKTVNLSTDTLAVSPAYTDAANENIGLVNLFSTGANALDPTKRNLVINPTTKVGYELFVVFQSSAAMPQPPTPAPPSTATATVYFEAFGGPYNWVPTHKGDYLVLQSNGTDWTLINYVIGGAALNGNGLIYQGTWNASTNTPTLTNPPDATTQGFYYIVSDAGTQFGYDFSPSDWIVSSGSAWQKVDNSENDMSLTSSHIYVGSSSNIATDVAVTGVIALDNLGVTTFNGSIPVAKLSPLVGSVAVVTDSLGAIVGSAVSDTELGYLGGVTSAIQTQLADKIGTTLTTGSILVGVGGIATELPAGTEGQFLKITGGIPTWTTYP